MLLFLKIFFLFAKKSWIGFLMTIFRSTFPNYFSNQLNFFLKIKLNSNYFLFEIKLVSSVFLFLNFPQNLCQCCFISIVDLLYAIVVQKWFCFFAHFFLPLLSLKKICYFPLPQLHFHWVCCSSEFEKSYLWLIIANIGHFICHRNVLNLKSHLCDICEKSLTENGHLKRQFKDVHQNLKPFKCKDCDS